MAPVGLWFRFGHWYLVAWDLERTAVRTFRVDRIEGEVTRGEAGEAVVPDDVSVDVKAALPEEPWEVEGEDRVEMRVRVDALEARRVVDEVGEDKVVQRLEDGSVDLVLGVSSFASIRSWVLGLSDHVTVMAPAAFRDELIAWLDVVRDATALLPADARAPDVQVAAVEEEPAAVRNAPGRETSRRLRRLLALVGWLAQVGEAPIADAAQRFGMSEKELVAELELAACCGIPPYTPDTLMEIEVSEHSVRAFLPAEYARPRRLTPAEGFAVAASARLLLAVPGLGRRRTAPRPGQARCRPRVSRGGRARRRRAGRARRGAGSGGRRPRPRDRVPLRLRDELTTRTVEPVQVATIDGHWYLDAYCHRAGDMRRFRVDRIGSVRPSDHSPGPAVTRSRPLEEMFVPGPGAVEVHLQLGPDAQWVPESVPVRAVRRDADGTVTDVILDVSGMAWFERLLLQLGPAVRVVSPPELAGLAAEAARRVLARYGSDSVGA